MRTSTIETALVALLMVALSLFIWLYDANSTVDRLVSACHHNGGVLVRSGEPGGSGGPVCVQPIRIEEKQ